MSESQSQDSVPPTTAWELIQPDVDRLRFQRGLTSVFSTLATALATGALLSQNQTWTLGLAIGTLVTGYIADLCHDDVTSRQRGIEEKLGTVKLPPPVP